MNNLQYLCSHQVGLRPTDCKEHFKVISEEAFQTFVLDGPGVDFDFSSDTVRCDECAREYQRDVCDMSQMLEIYERLERMLRGDGNPARSGMFYVSKRWLQSFRRCLEKLRKGGGAGKRNSESLIGTSAQKKDLIDFYGDRGKGEEGEGASEFELDGEVNGSLLCCHKNMIPNFDRKCEFVTRSTWDSISETWPAAIGIPFDTEACTDCVRDRDVSRDIVASERRARKDEISIPCLKSLSSSRNKDKGKGAILLADLLAVNLGDQESCLPYIGKR